MVGCYFSNPVNNTGYDLDKGAHSVYSLKFHYICCVKYQRKKFDTDKIRNKLKEINMSLAVSKDLEIFNQEANLNHTHMLFKTKSTTSLPKFINSLKGTSSRYLFQTFPEIKDKRKTVKRTCVVLRVISWRLWVKLFQKN